MAFSGSAKLKIGVLAPNSNFVPFLAKDLLTALNFGLAEAHLDAEIILGSAGYNADVNLVVPALQQLILERRVDCIIAPLNIAVIESISSHCENQGVPLIALNLTEDPRFESAQNPFVFINDFHLWHSAWMSGYLAAQRFGSRGASLSAIHDGGYGLGFASQLGLEAAQGTSVMTAVTHRSSNTEDPTPVIAEVAAQNPDFIWAMYSGKEAVSFFNAYKSSGFKDQIPLIVSSPVVSQNIRKAVGVALQETWYVTAENYTGKAKETIGLITAALGREPNPYALLAYEATHLIVAAVEGTDEKEFSEALRSVQFEGPRGLIKFNNEINIDAPFYLRQITADGETVENITAPPLLHEQYQLARRKLTKQGWINPYLCA